MNTHHTVIESVPVAITPIDHTYGVTLAVWSRRGSRDEEMPDRYGLTHFLEHMVFKGTDDRTATDIARAIEQVGGDLDAFTTRDHTCFMARIPADRVELGIEILEDMLLRPAFREEDIQREKQVVLEELRMSKDDPDDSGDETFLAQLYPADQLGRSILGTEESVRGFDREHLDAMRNDALARHNLVLSVAGRFDVDAITGLLNRFISHMPEGNGRPKSAAQQMTAGTRSRYRDMMDGVNVYAAFPTGTPELESQQRMAVLNTLLGGGMSSRLFRKIREDAGMAYMVYSAANIFRSEGHLLLHAATSADQAPRVMDMMVDEALQLKDTLTEQEVTDAVSQLTGRVRLALESTSAIAMYHGRNEAHYGHPVPLQQLLDILKGISYDEVRQLAADLFQKDRMAGLLYGNVTETGKTPDQ